MKLFQVYRIDANGRFVWVARISAKNKEKVRQILAEQGYEGRFMWATQADWQKIGAGNFAR